MRIVIKPQAVGYLRHSYCFLFCGGWVLKQFPLAHLDFAVGTPLLLLVHSYIGRRFESMGGNISLKHFHRPRNIYLDLLSFFC
jgi:hypothetical protein